MGRASILARTCGVLVAVGGLVAAASGLAGAVPGAGARFLPLSAAVTLAGVALAVSHRPRLRRALALLVVLASVGVVAAAVRPAVVPEPADPLSRGAVALFAIGSGLVLARTRLWLLSDVLAVVAGALAAGSLVAGLAGIEGSADDLLVAAPAVEACTWLVLAAGLLLGNTPFRAAPAPGWRPAVLAGVATAILSVLLFQSLTAREEDQLEAMLEVGAEAIRGELAFELRERRHALSLLAAEWEGKFFRLRGLWESDVRLILSRSPGLSAIEWIDASGAVGWKYPKGLEHPAPRIPEAASGPGRLRAFAVGPLPRADGRPAFRVLAPVSRSDPGQGWLSGIFLAEELLAGIARRYPPGWVVAVHAGDAELHRSPSADAAWAPGLARTDTVDVLRGLPLQVTAGASPALAAERRSRLPHTVLVSGLFLSLLLGFTLRLWLVTRGLARHLESRVAERTTELTRSNEGLRSFASFLSHELRQPVNAQALWTDLLESGYGAGLDDQGRRGISEVRRLAHRMGELIEGQLELFALSSAELRFGPVDLGVVLEEVARELKTEIGRAGARVLWEDLPVVHGDARQLHQLFQNLVDNALKYQRPEVPPRVELSARIQDHRAEILCRDQGRGFPANASERIFQIGLRLDDDGPRGHGLGLAMCRAIAERHGGSLTAEGRPGQGATFRIVLPLALPPTRLAAR